ncbi:MAG: ABC transporter permease, partial [Chloroflexota bacterium]|nr:ABC transporter permease [Chloroflexota bacterium]
PGGGFGSTLEKTFQQRDLLKSVLANKPSVKGVASSLFTPAQNGWANVDFRDSNGKKYQFNINFVDPHYLELMNINIVEGRSFSEENPSDSRRAIIVNKALIEEFGIQNPIGERLPGQNFEDHEIIGVTENFNYSSLKNEVEPLAISIDPNVLLSGLENLNFGSAPVPRITLKLASGNIPTTMDGIESAWSRVAPEQPFSYTFLDDAIDNQYRQEERLSQIVFFGSTFAVIIACLGLLGLAALMVTRRTKEIGVRKVLGASSLGIILLVNKEFTKLVAVSFLFATPIIWYSSSEWLQNFAYRIDLGISAFLFSGLITLTIAWITVSWQSIKATLIDPVESLRGE